MSNASPSPAFPYSFSRYLAAKKEVDDRALNQHVWGVMAQSVCPAQTGAPLRLLEVGCGIGTMWGRLVSRGFGPRAGSLAKPLHYFGVDVNEELILRARETYSLMLAQKDGVGKDWHARFSQADLFALPPAIQAEAPFDLLIAHAVLDLLHIPHALPVLFSYLRPGGIFYFTLNFDGETIFQPEHPDDVAILASYHRSMDERITHGQPSGDSCTGRHLFAHIKNAGGEILAAGSSDWVVFPGPDGYPGDEAYFLQHILHFFEQSLTARSDVAGDALAGWLALRHQQIEQGNLVFIAHQLDIAGRIPS